MKRISILVIAFLLIGLVIWLLSSTSVNLVDKNGGGILEQDGRGINVGDLAPNFELVDFEGDIVKLSDFRGRAVMVDFWAAWCPFCIAELPEIEEVSQELGDQVVVLGIHRSETESIDLAKQFSRDRGVSYALLQDSKGDVYKTYSGGRGLMPLAFFINADGVISHSQLGPKSKDQIIEGFSTALK